MELKKSWKQTNEDGKITISTTWPKLLAIHVLCRCFITYIQPTTVTRKIFNSLCLPELSTRSIINWFSIFSLFHFWFLYLFRFKWCIFKWVHIHLFSSTQAFALVDERQSASFDCLLKSFIFTDYICILWMIRCGVRKWNKWMMQSSITSTTHLVSIKWHKISRKILWVETRDERYLNLFNSPSYHSTILVSNGENFTKHANYGILAHKWIPDEHELSFVLYDTVNTNYFVCYR